MPHHVEHLPPRRRAEDEPTPRYLRHSTGSGGRRSGPPVIPPAGYGVRRGSSRLVLRFHGRGGWLVALVFAVVGAAFWIAFFHWRQTFTGFGVGLLALAGMCGVAGAMLVSANTMHAYAVLPAFVIDYAAGRVWRRGGLFARKEDLGSVHDLKAIEFERAGGMDKPVSPRRLWRIGVVVEDRSRPVSILESPFPEVLWQLAVRLAEQAEAPLRCREPGLDALMAGWKAAPRWMRWLMIAG